jgi:hypothetical protein
MRTLEIAYRRDGEDDLVSVSIRDGREVVFSGDLAAADFAVAALGARAAPFRVPPEEKCCLTCDWRMRDDDCGNSGPCDPGSLSGWASNRR